MQHATRGNAAEAAVLAALVERGFDVLLPFGGGHPYDMAVHVGDRWFVRVQCKTAWPSGGCLLFNSKTTDHGKGQVSYVGLADVFGVYFPPTQAVYLVPVAAVASRQGRLRLLPAQNNQRRRVRLAMDFEIDGWTREALRQTISREGARTEPIGLAPCGSP